MKYQGRIQQWDDAKGFGFVEPNGGGIRAFAHIKAFKQRSRRPINGDIIVYEVEQDRKGNHRACNISLLKDHKAKRLRANKPTSQRKRNVIVLSIFSGALALFTLSGRLPFIVPIVYGAVSLLTILFYGIDKSAAKKEKRRVSEAKLHILSLLGGWPGALLACSLSNSQNEARKLARPSRRASLKCPYSLLCYLDVDHYTCGNTPRLRTF